MGIDIDEVLRLNNPNIIDIRENYLYNMGHLLESVNITYGLLNEMHYNYLDQNETYYLYCSEGRKSKILADKLNSLGYNCINIRQGYNYFKNIL